MSDPVRTQLRHILTYPGAAKDDPEGHAMLKAHREKCGTWPHQTPAEEAHSLAVVSRKVGGRERHAIMEHTCAECGIVWVTG